MGERGVVRHLWALDAPHITADKSICQVMTGGENVTIPAPSFLLEHEYGLLMFDTGLAVDAAGDPSRAYGELAQVFPMDFPEEYRLDRQLADLGVHDCRRQTSGSLPRALRPHRRSTAFPPMRSATSVSASFATRRVRRCWTPGCTACRTSTTGPRPGTSCRPAMTTTSSGDGSVTILSLPGHTVGSVGLQVRLPGRTVVLTGDAAHLQSNIDLLAGDAPRRELGEQGERAAASAAARGPTGHNGVVQPRSRSLGGQSGSGSRNRLSGHRRSHGARVDRADEGRALQERTRIVSTVGLPAATRERAPRGGRPA